VRARVVDGLALRCGGKCRKTLAILAILAILAPFGFLRAPEGFFGNEVGPLRVRCRGVEGGSSEVQGGGVTE